MGSKALASAIGGDSFDLYKAPTSPGEIKLGVGDGKSLSLTDYLGKVVILNFWRKDCPYCVVEKDYLKKFVERFDPADLVILSVNLWDDPKWVLKNASNLGNHISVATRIPGNKGFVENVVRGRLMGYYVINEANEAIFEIKGFPSTYVVDKSGKVVAGHTGLVNWLSPAVDNTVRTFLKVKVTDERKAAIVESGVKWLNELMSPPRDVQVSLLK
jgi:thiol-disulfide isomerase/thioredoxin